MDKRVHDTASVTIVCCLACTQSEVNGAAHSINELTTPANMSW